MLDPGIFKAYDVRGLYGPELDEEGAYAIGRAYVEHFKPRSIAVGRDMRLSAPSMAAAVMEGAADGGADVRDLGMVGTEMVYYAVGELGLDGGICVTASHNPKQYTGMKIVRQGALPVGGDSGLERVRAGAEAGFGPVTKRGEITPLDVWPGFVDKVLSFIDLDEIAPLRIVVDAANGMAGAMLPPVLERLPTIEVVRCYFDPDGTFPNHEPNPLLEENRAFIIAKTREEGAALGVAYDGDADRCFFVDDTGAFVPGDFVTALLAQVMLEKHPGGTVLYDLRASWAVPRTIAAAGGTALMSRVGHAFIKHRMREENALFAGEVSAHYYFRDFTQADTGVVPFLLMLELLSKRGVSLSEILRPFREQYFITGEINTPVADVQSKLQEIEGALHRRGRADLAPRRHLGRLRHLALQRAAVEHGAPAPAQPRGDLRGRDDRPPRRARDADRGLSDGRSARARPRHRPASAVSLLGSHPRLVLRHGRAGSRLLRPLHAVLRSRPQGVPSPPRLAPGRGWRVRDARDAGRVPRTRPLRRRARVLCPRRQDRPHQHHVRGRRVQAPRRRPDGDGNADRGAHRQGNAPPVADPHELDDDGDRVRGAPSRCLSQAP